jgi:hypothetical protein
MSVVTDSGTQHPPLRSNLPQVEYRWDKETEILSAKLRSGSVSEGAAGLIEIVGRDGSWVNIDLCAGRVQGVEVAVWPDVRDVKALVPPSRIADEPLHLPMVKGADDMGAVEIETPLLAEADGDKRTIHFALGSAQAARTVRVANQLLVDLDARGRLAGLWLLNVPPQPADL